MSRTLPVDIAKYLQFKVREWVRSGRTAAELAELAGISGAQVSELQNKGVGAGWKTSESLAKVFGMTMPQLIEAATVWATKQPATPTPRSALRPLVGTHPAGGLSSRGRPRADRRDVQIE